MAFALAMRRLEPQENVTMQATQVKLPLAWVNSDGKLLMLARGLRTVAQGIIAVLLAIYLDKLGFSLAQIGLVITAGLVGAIPYAVFTSLLANRLGQRRLLVAFSLAAAIMGVALATVQSLPALMALAFLTSFAGGGGGNGGPLVALEQAGLTDSAPPPKRTDLFALFNIVSTAAMAIGSLAAGLPQVLQDSFGMGEMAAFRAIMAAYAALNLGAVACYALLSPRIEAAEAGQTFTNPFKLPSRRVIFTISGLFGLDFFAGGLILQSLVSLWFYSRFGVKLTSIALIFFAAQLMSAVPLWLASKLSDRIGLINTIAWTNAVAAFLLMAIPFVPALWMAVALWLARSFFNQMDVPARQSYTMTVVGPEERVPMSSINSLTRSVAVAGSPSVATWLWSIASGGLPFFVTGALKLVYDVALWAMFHNVKTPEEQRRAEERARRRKKAVTPAGRKEGEG